MTVAVINIVKQAMELPSESRTELVEAILEESKPSVEFLAEQMKTVRERMEAVREGRSTLISAEEAHRRVRKALFGQELSSDWTFAKDGDATRDS